MSATTVSVSENMKRIYPKFNDSRPHVETNYDDSALSNSASNSDKNIFMIGSASDGDPTKVYTLKTLSQAKGTFGSGDLVNAMELAWDPSNNSLTSGGTIYAMRAEDATQASLTKGSLVFTSKVFGDSANKVGISLDKDIVTGSPRITVTYEPKSYSRTYTNIGNMFSIKYTGTSASAGFSVEKGADGYASKLTLATGDSIDKLTEVKSFDLTSQSYSTMAQLIQGISLVSGFSGSVIGSTVVSTKYIDEVNPAVDCKTSAVTVTAKTGDALHALRYDSYVNVTEYVSGAAKVAGVTTTDNSATVTANSVATAFPDDFDTTYLSGGMTGTVPVSWANKFSNVQGIDAYYIVALTDEENIHAELKAFLDEEEDEGYNYRGFVGGSFNESPEEMISRQLSLKDERINLVGQSGYYANLSGANIHIPAYLMAAYAAGVASSLQIGGALTNKYIDLVSLDQELTGDQLDLLNQNGVISIEKVVNRNASGGYRFVQDVTTYNSTNEPVKSRLSLGELTDFLFDDLRIYLEQQFIGVNIRLTTADDIKAAVSSFLYNEASSDNGLIVSYQESDITVSIDGDKAYIVFSAAPSQTMDNMVVYGTFSNYTAESTSETDDTNTNN
ncbi:tail sheath protein [Lactobacillus phage LpeD]|uniref:Tail sheath protein n=1 Tax=Lactobacillus phage LpeD TaxID=2041210 RepID=A0A291I9G3_9CAUD|nr:tail sheath [Lactobacillus phage LpeD]ATG86324.1 tail sheath protein [Lactobacillus phage LpeD]